MNDASQCASVMGQYFIRAKAFVHFLSTVPVMNLKIPSLPNVPFFFPYYFFLPNSISGIIRTDRIPSAFNSFGFVVFASISFPSPELTK